ncbi:MAG: ChbG/HpnK family deacetylase, partial [Acidobacteriota bacterium]|nr:ChbG/HpnK family deacetylase [Acidobacteriota bacterium]
LDEVRSELRAQIERGRKAGLEIDYLDYHMLTAVSTPELRTIVEELAREYGLGLATYFGERSASLWDVAPEKKLSRLLQIVGLLPPDRPNLLVMHLGIENPEMSALVDLNNAADPFRVAIHRQAELEALTSPAFRRAVSETGVRLVTYRDLIARHGLDAMVRPTRAGYSMED